MEAVCLMETSANFSQTVIFQKTNHHIVALFKPDILAEFGFNLIHI
jgi:hypothetical protein